MDKVYVIGHKKPDTDAVCGSISLSYLKNALGLKTEPRILSEINSETKYALNRFNIPIPEYLNDVKVQISDLNYKKDFYAEKNKSIYKTYKQITKNEATGIPIVNGNNLFLGYVSLKEISKDLIINTNDYLDTTFDNVASTLYATKVYKYKNQVSGKITFQNKDLTKKILITDNNKIIENPAIKNLELLVIVNNQNITQKQQEILTENKVNTIITPYNLYKTSNIISLSNPINSIKRDSSVITFKETDYLTDFKDISNKYKHTNYPIVDSKGICGGMLRVIDSSEIRRKNVILVDHNELNQSVDGLLEANIIEIVDHHNIGNISTNSPINFRNMNVGSVNTIIYFMYKENNIKIPKDIASIMLSGILSDTLILKSPTTTETDKKVADELSKISKLDINKYGLELLKSGVSIKGKTPKEIINQDLKIYTKGENKLGVSQVFTTSFNEYKTNLDRYVDELNNLSENIQVIVLFVTDILKNDSYIIYNESSKDLLEEAYNINNLNQGKLFKGVVSRKKQMVPQIIEVMK